MKAFTALFLVCLLATPAAAQVNFTPRDLTRGVTTASESGVAGDYDATAVARNPAGLAMLGGPSIVFGATELGSERTLIGGGGWGLALGFPLRFSFLPFTYSYGFGYQGVDSPESWRGPITGAENADGSYLLNSVGIGTDRLSLGWTIANFFWANTPQRDSILTHHVGIAFRPWRHLALGATIRDVFEPVGRAPEEKFERSYEAEVMIRPFGDWRVEVGGGVLIGEDGFVDDRGRLVLRLVDGVSIFAQYDSVARHYEDANGPITRDHRFMAGITLNGIDGLLGGDPTLAVSYAALGSTKSPTLYGGSAVALRWSSERYPTLIARRRVEKLVFDEALEERAFVRRLLHLEQSARADDIAGLVLVLGETSMGWGRAEELRDAVLRLRRSGKKVLAYLRAGTMRAYYVASACDRVLLHPATPLELRGTAAQMVYFKDLFDEIGIGAQVVQFAEFKSAGEPFTRSSSSPAARAQIEAYLSDVHQQFVAGVAADRGLDPRRVERLLAQTGVTPAQARVSGLIDDIAFPDEIDSATRDLFGKRIAITTPSQRPQRAKQWRYPRIALIYIEGEILSRSGGIFVPTPAGRTIAHAIARARESSSVEAIVLRVNSPGGAVLPSEEIAREVELTRGKKPIIVSMGDVAASGGYMAAAYGDAIYAPRAALTGSIGIIAMKLEIGGLMARLGLSPETIKTEPHADADSIFRPWSPREEQGVGERLSYFYDRFKGMVASGRRLPSAKVAALAKGRVWSGHRALRHQLIDHTGSVLDALEEARRLAGMGRGAEAEIVHWPTVASDLLQQLAAPTAGGKASRLLPRPVRALLRAVPAAVLSGEEELVLLPWVELPAAD